MDISRVSYNFILLEITLQPVPVRVKLLLVFASTVIPGIERRRDPKLCFYSLQETYFVLKWGRLFFSDEA
jgi:hypothetical protein